MNNPTNKSGHETYDDDDDNGNNNDDDSYKTCLKFWKVVQYVILILPNWQLIFLIFYFQENYSFVALLTNVKNTMDKAFDKCRSLKKNIK